MNPKASFGNYAAASCGVLYPLLRPDKIGIQLTHSATLRFRNGSFTIKVIILTTVHHWNTSLF